MANSKRKKIDWKKYEGINYSYLLHDIKTILELEEVWSKRSLNQIKLQINWRIGERITEEVKGQTENETALTPLYKQLARDLGITARYLFSTVRFYRLYPVPQYLSPELTWTHYASLINIENENIRRFYELQSIENRWSVKELNRRIKLKEHEKLEKSGVPLPPPLPAMPQIDDIIKNKYYFDFVQLPPSHSERDLEQGLINQIGKFLLELGYGFCFMGNQRKIDIGGNKHYIDLVFFHVDLACYVLVDLKVEKFNDSFIGQMNKYLNYFSKRINLPYMRPPIGILICKSWNTEEVYYALGGLEKKMFVAEYQFQLPTKQQLIDALKQREVGVKAKISGRQRRTLKELADLEIFDIHQYQKLAGVSLATAQRDMIKLIKAKVLIKEGGGRSTRYILNTSLLTSR